MILKKLALVLFGATAVALPGCGATLQPWQTGGAPPAASEPGTDLQSVYADLGRTGSTLFALPPQDSGSHASRAGLAVRLGHNHIISAPQFTGFFHPPLSGAANDHLDRAFRLDQPKVDQPGYRSELGEASSPALLPEARKSTQEHLLRANDLQADRFPFVHIDVVGLPDRLSSSDSFVLRQSDFDVQPFSLLSGPPSVRDKVVLDFKFVRACRLDTSSHC